MDFSKIIIQWYEGNKRDLPWRHTKDPYKIWLSEIILQQTRVQQGLPYYHSFIEKFPTIKHLAKANIRIVLKTWQGLGYYSRARNLHFTAKYITEEYNGKFPHKYEEILKLKGIGQYTASAIASFAFNLPHVVVDGNVYRVLSRYFGISMPIDSTEGKNIFFQKASYLLDKDNPALFNQAIMEFGAIQCTPHQPNCSICPLNKNCDAYAANAVMQLPVKAKKIKIRTRHFYYFIFREKDFIFIHKRNDKDIWRGLYDFPVYESAGKMPIKTLRKQFFNNTKNAIEYIGSDEQQLSHQKIHAHFFAISFLPDTLTASNYVRIPVKKIHRYPMPKIVATFVNKHFSG